MEQEQILSELKAKAGTTGLSDMTLKAYVGANLPAEGTEPDEAYWSKHVGFIKTLSGNYNHDVAEQVTSQVKAKTDEFAKKYKPAPQPETGNQEGKDAYAELLKRVEAMEETARMQREKAAADGLKRGVMGKAGSLRVTNTALWNDSVESVRMEAGMDEEKLLSEAKKAYESKLKSYFGNGAAPYGGNPDGGAPPVSDKQANAKRDAFMARMAQRGVVPPLENH